MGHGLIETGDGPERGVGFVIRDGSGRFIAARSVNLRVVSSAICAEALACRGALFFASELGMESIVVEGGIFTDCANGWKKETLQHRG
ncbi:hypothetical protein RHGRI_001759 [Rhododendron griersonianum]|uniref:RNase H type-1 domain-containing protein n=1 Tax=Rhododendron griersonianum TaxID=479676 RepID=A0AAV6LMP0_9ERIC|nr:hypothetical protein RHGRI_001759 [Rhododendron griersonianum]